MATRLTFPETGRLVPSWNNGRRAQSERAGPARPEAARRRPLSDLMLRKWTLRVEELCWLALLRDPSRSVDRFGKVECSAISGSSVDTGRRTYDGEMAEQGFEQCGPTSPNALVVEH